MKSTSCTRFRVAWACALLRGVPPLRAAQETELKDETGKTILKYVIEVPPGMAAAGTTDPARQVGLILCSQEHDTPTGNDLFPVRQSLLRQGLLDQLRAGRASAAGPQIRPRRSPADREADRLGEEDVSHQSAPRIHVWERRGLQDFDGVHDDASQHRHRRHRLQLGRVADAFGGEGAAGLREQRSGDLPDAGPQGSGESPLLRARRLLATAGKGIPLHLSRVRRTWRSHLPSSEQ